jgi:four helix bundle protein
MSENLIKPETRTIKNRKGKQDSPIKTKSFAFAIRIVNLYKYLTTEKGEHILAKKILSSGTAIGALVREAEGAESKADFIHKLSIALKEAQKTEYWILLLHQTEYIEDKACYSLRKDLVEILKLLVSIIKTTKNNQSNRILNSQLSILNSKEL